MDLSALPHYYYIPGRQDAINNAGRISKTSFLVSTGVLFGAAILCIITRFAIRVLNHRQFRWDDGLVLFATMTMIVSYGICLHYLDTLYLIEASNYKVAFPFQEDVPRMLEVIKWSTIFTTMSYTSVYMVKFAFMYFFHVLIHGMPRRTIIFYWTTVVVGVLCWLESIVNIFIICPKFGTSGARCSSERNYHARSLAGNIVAFVLDIICDSLIVALPIVILQQSMMSFHKKLSIAAMLCLSIAMIICSLVRLAGTITDTKPDGSGAEPVWATYWTVVEGCVSLIMTSVIVIRSVFITQAIRDDRKRQESMVRQLGRRLLSTLWLPGSSRSSRRSPHRVLEDQDDLRPSTPRIATQGLTRITLSNVKRFIGNSRDTNNRDNNESRDDTLKSVDTAYILEDLNYHTVRRDEVRTPRG